MSLALLVMLASVASTKIGVVAHDAARLLARGPGDEAVATSSAVAEPSRLEPAAGPQDEAAPPDHAGKDPEPATGPNESVAAPARRLALDRLSQSEFEVLQQLAERRAELEARARQLDQHAALVAAAESELAAQLKRLEQLRAEIAAMVSAQDATEEARLASLVKIYESMKPKAAAEIFNRLDLPILISVLERMREARSADVLSRMDPAKARQVTAELARRAEWRRGSGSS